MCRLDYLVLGHEVSIFTDHANLVYFYDPFGKNPGISRHTASKLMRWAIKLSAFRYVIEHLPGDRNIWADMLTRWAVRPKRTLNSKHVSRLKSLLMAPISPGIDFRLDWPSLKDIISSQEAEKEKPRGEFKRNDNGWVNSRGVHWIPRKHKLLQLRILIAAHTGLGGHRSWRVTKTMVQAHFFWVSVAKDVELFVQSCLHCLCTQTGAVVPRPLGHALHAEKPNELFHFDFCFMSKGENGNCYVLIPKDDHRGYVWLTETTETTAEATADVMIRWFAALGVVKQWVSDGGSHFKNELIKRLREQLKSSHHFTLAYCPWSNGTVEVVCRELLRATRALLSEFQLPRRCWPSVLPIVQSTLNNTVLDRLGNRCPLTVFTGLPHDSPLTSIKYRHRDAIQVKHIDEVRARHLMSVHKLQMALEGMHKDVARHSTRKREKAIEAHNRKTNVRPVNFWEGDYVLRGVLEREHGRKPSLRWRGPFRVVQCMSKCILVVEDLLNGKRDEVHGRRLKLFRNKSYEVTEELKNHLAYQACELLVIDRFDDIRRVNGNIQLLIKWKGFSEEESDWVDLDSLRHDVPTLLAEGLKEFKKNETFRQRAIGNSI